MLNPLPSLAFSAVVAGAALFPGSALAGDAFRIEFVEPERFTDAHLDSYSHGVDQRVLRSLKQHLQSLAKRCLHGNQALDIQVLDIDLAGHQEWWGHRGAHDLRVMRDITWPRIDLDYTLRTGDGQIKKDRERVSDMHYLWRSAYMRSDSTLLPYERAMLTTWFERRFCR